MDNHRAMAKTKPAVDTSDSPALYPIRTLSSLTGVNSVTLRAWERRYNLIRPQRTACFESCLEKGVIHCKFIFAFCE